MTNWIQEEGHEDARLVRAPVVDYNANYRTPVENCIRSVSDACQHVTNTQKDFRRDYNKEELKVLNNKPGITPEDLASKVLRKVVMDQLHSTYITPVE